MSNPLKGIGRIFKKVLKTAKKIALPALAIAAVVLTGGAALGALPGVAAGVGGSAAIGSALGLSSASIIPGIISAAGTGALMGGATAAITGKNILKGLTTGALVGGATGGIGQLLRPAASVAQTASTVAKTASSAFSTPISYAASQAPSMGLDSLAQGGLKAATSAAGSSGGLSSIVSAGAGAVPNAASSLAPAKSAGVTYSRPMAAPEPMPITSVSTDFGVPPEVGQYASMPITPVSTGGSVLGGLGRFVGGINPYVGGKLIQGIGGGIMAMQQAKDENRKDKRDRASYEDTSGYFQPGDFGQFDTTERNWRWAIDETTGRPFKEYR